MIPSNKEYSITIIYNNAYLNKISSNKQTTDITALNRIKKEIMLLY